MEHGTQHAGLCGRQWQSQSLAVCDCTYTFRCESVCSLLSDSPPSAHPEVGRSSQFLGGVPPRLGALWEGSGSAPYLGRTDPIRNFWTGSDGGSVGRVAGSAFAVSATALPDCPLLCKKNEEATWSHVYESVPFSVGPIRDFPEARARTRNGLAVVATARDDALAYVKAH